MPDTMRDRYRQCESTLGPRGQAHLLRWWPHLSDSQRRSLLAETEGIPWQVLDPVIATHVLQRPSRDLYTDLEPASVYSRIPVPENAALYEKAVEHGRMLLSRGKVAAFTVAGGQATRLGADRPKGTVIVTPAGDQTLFELFAQTIRAAGLRYQARIPWYIMTSPANHQQTLDFLTAHSFFGLPVQDVMLFPQGVLPAFDFRGRILLADKGHLALAPDGHGGSLAALVRSDALGDMQRQGIEIISYFQVDNPLVKPFDPLFIGLHALTGSEMSTKVAAKVDDFERVGNVCLHKGKVTVIEYSDFPDEFARAKDARGRRTFDAGNLAIHLLNTAFVDRVVAHSFQMPLRRAEKVVPYLDESGVLQQPKSPNAVKLETFIFDALPLANNPLVLEVDRVEEFSPVKNATGMDSLETAKRDQSLRACRWLEAADIQVPRKPDGSPDITIAISPLFALDTEDVRAKKPKLPPLQAGMTIWLE